MGRKRASAEGGASVSPGLIDRILCLADRIWDNNQSEMARNLEVDQASISRVLGRKQQPGAKLLERLATWPRVNAYWLFSGEGEAVVETVLGPGGGRFRPVVERLLPGTPQEHPELLTGVSFPVADAFFSATSYWWRVPYDGGPGGEHGVLARDLLLMETDPKWTRRGTAVSGKFAGVRMKRGKGRHVVLARVDSIEETDPLTDLFEVYPVKLYGEREKPHQGPIKFVVPGSKGEKPSFTASKAPLVLTPEDVVCVAIKLDRVYGGEQFYPDSKAARRP